MTKWYEKNGGDTDVIVSTRVRLARNVKGFPFPARMKPAQRKQAVRLVQAAMQNENAVTAGVFNCVDMGPLSKAEAVSLVERHLVTPDFISAREGCALFHNGDESLCVMVNGSDHLRLCSMAPGLDLEGAYSAADNLETVLGRVLDFSFHPALGYLSQNPMNLGTGMHASLMLHLPGLSGSGAVERVAAGLARLGLQLQASAPEGQAGMYLLSNHVTMGLSEKEAMANLKSIGLQLVVQERGARHELFRSLETQDAVGRSLGILKGARVLKNGEFMELISNVRCGISMEMIEGLRYETVSALIVRVQPATLSCAENGAERSARDALRAKIVAQALQDARLSSEV